VVLTDTNQVGDWLGAIPISNYETMWLAHGSQVIDHMTRNKEGIKAHLAGGILHAQVCSKGWKMRNIITSCDKMSVIRA
jgi:hypothetical protein